MENVYEMWDLFERVTPIINVYICQLFDIAESRGKCKYDQYGDSYLDEIPEDILCESVLAALNKEGILILYDEIIEDKNTVIQDKYENIKEEVKDLLTWCFTKKIKEDSNMVKIIGHTSKNINIKIPIFHALSFYKFIYESESIQDLTEYYIEHIKIPYISNGLIIEPKLKKYKNVYTLEESEKWYLKMKSFMRDEADKNAWNSFREDIELDKIKRSMPYIEKSN